VRVFRQDSIPFTRSNKIKGFSSPLDKESVLTQLGSSFLSLWRHEEKFTEMSMVRLGSRLSRTVPVSVKSD
jgi:hypothetical protein